MRRYLAIFLISTATLTHEIGLTRLFSFAQGYHFAFMVVSIALLGIGAGGTVLMLGRWKGEGVSSGSLSLFSALFSISVVLSYVAANRILFDPIVASWSKAEFGKILVQYLILSAPFVFSGMVISGAMRAFSGRVHRIYLSDLLGAATGSLLILLILTMSGGEGAVVVAAFLSLAASLLFGLSSTAKARMVFGAALVLVVLSAIGAGTMMKPRVSPYRDLPTALNFPGARLNGTLYTPSGRLDVVESPAVRAAPGIGLSYSRPLPEQRGFTVNGGGLNTVTSRSGDPALLSFLSHMPSALPYRLSGGGEVFVVNPGGGMEILSALEAGASRVSGSETSSVVMEAMSAHGYDGGPLYDFSGRLYDDARISHGHAREVLKGLARRFDVISIPLTGTLGASSSGIRGLTEDYTLTVEAFVEYMDRLKPGGFLTASLYLLPPPRAELKLLSTAVSAMEDVGVERPEESVAAVRSLSVMTLIVKKGAIDSEEAAIIKAFSKEEGFDVVWYPGMASVEANLVNRFPEPIYHDNFKAILEPEEREVFLRDYIFDLRPATDERPFFSETFKFSRVLDTYESVGRKWGILIEGGYLLPWILVEAVVSTLILILLPFLFMRKGSGGGGRRGRGARLTCVSVYFAAIGAGFIFVEIALIQRLLRVLGEPVYAISAVLFSILLSTGAGSYISGRVGALRERAINTPLVVAFLTVAYLINIDSVSEVLLGFPLYARYALTFVVLFPLGLVMGAPFPTGIAMLGRTAPELIPWAWSINGTVSVVGSVFVMILALAWGFSAAFIFAAFFYAIAWVSLRVLGASG